MWVVISVLASHASIVLDVNLETVLLCIQKKKKKICEANFGLLCIFIDY